MQDPLGLVLIASVAFVVGLCVVGSAIEKLSHSIGMLAQQMAQCEGRLDGSDKAEESEL